jgi:hypothetical protein
VGKQRQHSLLGAKARKPKKNSVRSLREATTANLSTFICISLPDMRIGRADPSRASGRPERGMAALIVVEPLRPFTFLPKL